MTQNFTISVREDLLQSIEFAVKFNSAGKATNAGRGVARGERAEPQKAQQVMKILGINQ